MSAAASASSTLVRDAHTVARQWPKLLAKCEELDSQERLMFLGTMTELTSIRLWNAALSPRDAEVPDSTEAVARSRLRSELTLMRDRAAMIVGEIPRDLAHFTVHDITHLDGLWDMADIVAGEEYKLTPIEAFVFGGAVLLHDAAMTLAAYPGREAELRLDLRWKDALALGLRKVLGRRPTETELLHPPAEVEKAADEETLRLRHAEQAELVATQAWKLATGEPVFVIRDDELRASYGTLIGKIAHSHWWNIEVVAREFGSTIGGPAWAPQSWRLDPLKVACLLRVADAAHLDARRAPPFLSALRNIRGVSADHWTFQARLAKPHVEEDRIVYSTAQPFLATEMEAWWQCFDALQTLDREIRQTDALFLETKRERFRVRSVAGADAPARLRKHVPTLDWEPLDLRVRVTDVPALVERLGGKELYGDDPTVVLRELIQNAIDAVHARRVLEGRADEWGEIVVSLGNDTHGAWLDVADTGIGMSAQVLAGPLLDFGVSYWATSLAREEHPGLLARGFASIGRYGIGFFSVFMLGDRVRVTTRRPQDGMQETRVLEFGRGVWARPVLRKASRGEQLMDPGTHVRVWLRTPADAPDGLLGSHMPGGAAWSLDLLCAWLAPVSSVNILVGEGDTTKQVVAANDWRRISASTLLDRIWANGTQSPFSPYESVLEECAHRLRDLTAEDGRCLGRATIIPTTLKMDAWRSAARTGLVVVGGLNASGLQGIAGVLLGEPVDAARRHARPIADGSPLATWATHQAELVSTYQLPAPALESCAEIIRSLGGEPRGLPIARHRRKWRTYADIASLNLPDEVVLVSDSFVYLAESPHGPGTLLLGPNVLVANSVLPGILMSDYGSRHRVSWPDSGDSSDSGPQDPFISRTLRGLVIEAVAAAWGVPVQDVLNLSQMTTDKRRIVRQIGTLLGTPIKEDVDVLVRPRKRPRSTRKR
jgi:hypothetical protein